MFKFFTFNVNNKKASGSFEELLNSGWEIKQMQTVCSTDGSVIEVVAILFKAG